MSTFRHMGIDVKGFIRNASSQKGKKGWLVLGATDGQGRLLTADEVRMKFLQHLDAGHRVIPMGECDSWDYEKGCPGHSEEGK